MSLGERIAALRKEKGLSQEALGEIVGVTRQAVSKWEADKALPDVNNCVAMSKVFGISLMQLLALEDTEAAVSEELSEKQLGLVERMAEQYAAAQKKIRRRWRWPIILFACALLPYKYILALELHVRSQFSFEFREHIITESLCGVLAQRATGMFFDSVKNISHNYWVLVQYLRFYDDYASMLA